LKPALRNWLILAGILGVTFLLTLAVARRHRVIRLSPAPSTFNTSPPGLKAAYTTLERLRLPVERWQHPWTKLPGRRGLLVYADLTPDELFAGQRAFPPTEEECHALARWVAGGNTLLLLANSDFDIASTIGPLLEKLGLTEPTTNHAYRVDRHHSTEQLFEPPTRMPITLSSVMPTTFTRGVRELRVARNAGLQSERGAYVPLVAGEDQSLHALWLSHGHGQVLMFSSASFFDNEFIGQADNFALLMNAVQEGTILFDEYHHGYSQEFAMGDFLRLPMVRFAAAQVALLLGLLIWSQSRRFGEPVPLVRETRRSVMEYAVALGDLYARAETQLEALDYLYKNLRQEFADRLDANLAADIERHLQTRSLTRLQFTQLTRRIQEFRRQLR
jgi:hypothetical protein